MEHVWLDFSSIPDTRLYQQFDAVGYPMSRYICSIFLTGGIDEQHITVLNMDDIMHSLQLEHFMEAQFIDEHSIVDVFGGTRD